MDRNIALNHSQTADRRTSRRGPRFENRSAGRQEESFDQRAERARSLPSEYAAEFAQWVSTDMDRDQGAASYYAFEVWTKAGWGDDFRQIAQRLQRACQYATCDMFPALPRTSLNRIPAHLCLSAILLPAQKRDGVPHVHGFIRVPARAQAAGLALLTVQTNGTNVKILAPQVVAGFVQYVRQLTHGAPTSFHLDHCEAQAVDLVADRDRREHKLKYLTESGPEVRSWDRLELVPGRVWKRLLKSWDAGVEHDCATSASALASSTATCSNSSPLPPAAHIECERAEPDVVGD